MADKVEFGYKNVHVAFLDEATGEYAAPVPVPGAVKASLAPEGEATEFFADDINYFPVTANSGYKGELEQALWPDAVLAEMLGWETDENGMVVELADALPKPFALLYEITTDKTGKRRVWWHCAASRPSEERETKGKSITPKTTTLPIVITPVDIDGITVVGGSVARTAQNAAVYDAWYTAVQKPSFASA